MSFFQFIQIYLLLVVAGSLAVSGWFFVTRGRTETLPDGTKVRKGKLFKGWYFFFTRTKGRKKDVFFHGEQLKNLVANMKPRLLTMAVPHPTEHMNCTPSLEHIGVGAWYRYKNTYAINDKDLADIEREFDVKISIRDKDIAFYKEYDQYVFPEWIRDPLAVCATCFSSIYGSAFYWGVVSCIPGLFAWSTTPVFSMTFFWIAFCLSLAVTNTSIAKKFN